MTFFVSRTFRAELTIFVDRNTRYNAELLAPVLARYYDITDSWSGIDEIFQDPPWLVSRDMRRPVPYRTQLFWPEDRRLLIANSEANIVFDSKSELAGSLMTASVLESAIPISLTANAQPSGYVLIGSTHEPMLIERFQADFRRGVIIVALMISSIAILIGFLISRQLTAPIRRLTRATANTSVGNWPYTTTTSPGRDEVGQLEQAFSDMTVRLHHAQEQRLQLIADVAHELRTPLTVLKTNLEGMIDSIIPIDQNNIALTLNQTHALERLINDLRLISLTDARELQLDLQMCSLTELTLAVIEVFQPAAEEADIALSMIPTQSAHNAIVDPLRFQQVLGNLISNAVRYLNALETITVSIHSTETTIEIAVSDSGPGIPEGDREHIFERFYRADKSRSRGTGGSGLGLAIAKGLAEAHGGSLMLSDETPHGATFIISLLKP